MERGIPTRLTTDGGNVPIWSPDGTRTVFQSNRGGALEISQKPSSSVGQEKLLFSHKPDNVYPLSWSPDGQFLLYEIGSANSPTGNDVWVLPLSGESKPRPLLQEPFDEFLSRFSPDGRWIAYVSRETTRNVRRRPAVPAEQSGRTGRLVAPQDRHQLDGRIEEVEQVRSLIALQPSAPVQ